MMDNGDKKIYPYDSVYKFDYERNRLVFGLVDDCYGYELEDVELKRGEIQVRWEQNPYEGDICQESEVRLMSRYIASGEVVKKVGNGLETQKGLCLETKEITTVQVKSTGAIVEHVARNRLYDDFWKTEVGDAVSFGDHVGRIMKVNRLFRMRSRKDNVRVTARANIDEDQIRECGWANVGNNNFRRIIACVPNTLIDPKWHNGTECNDMEKEQEFIIMEDRLYSLQVCWLLPDGDTKIEEFEGDDMEKLNIMGVPHDLDPGTFFFMKTDPDDIFIETSEWFQQLSDRLITDKEKRGRKRDYESISMSDHFKHTEPDEELLVMVICVESRVTVLWQDGTEERDILSNELYLWDSLDDHEFFPGYWVVFNKLDEDEDVWGVVKSVDFTERVAKVQWSTHAFGCSCSECKESKNFNLIDEQSVYDLKLHYEFDMFFINLRRHDKSIFCKSTTNGAMLGKQINILPENGSIVVQWSDDSTEYYLPGHGHEGFKTLPLLKDFDLLRDLKSLSINSSSDLSERYENETTGCNKESEKISDAVNDDETLVVEGFCLLDEAPEKHAYYSNKFEPKDMRKFVTAIQHEYKLLKKSLPAGVWVHAYGDRTDLLSVMIRGAKDTPYEDGLFMFDIQLCADYPENPPQVHFISYIDEQLNPNLYIEGKVCVSLLGTWHGEDSEEWTTNSNLLQLIVSIQGLILVAEPYYNEAGYERDRYTQKGQENSRAYNESAILKVLKSMTELLRTCPQEFQSVVRSHFKKNGEEIIRRIESFCNEECTENPDYPLLPLSKGVKLSLNLHLKKFSKTLAKVSEVSKSNQFSF